MTNNDYFVNNTQPSLDDDNDTKFSQVKNQSSALNCQIEAEAVVPESMLGWRFDQIAAQLFDQYSREKLKQWMQQGDLTVNGLVVKAKSRSQGGELIKLSVALEPQLTSQAEAIDLDVIYQDEAIVVINKPVGMVVHPGAGNHQGTLLNGILYHFPQNAQLDRAGLVHRIDKDTSGLLVIAKTLEAQFNLIKQLSEKSVYRIYDLVVWGQMIAGCTVDEPIKRHPQDRVKMAVHAAGKPAVTHLKLQQKFAEHTLVQAQLETGRTHQIRVHLQHLGFPLVGDPVYLGRARHSKHGSEPLKAYIQQFKRQALHARQLGLQHPVTGEQMLFEAPWPDDFAQLVTLLRQSIA